MNFLRGVMGGPSAGPQPSGAETVSAAGGSAAGPSRSRAAGGSGARRACARSRGAAGARPGRAGCGRPGLAPGGDSWSRLFGTAGPGRAGPVPSERSSLRLVLPAPGAATGAGSRGGFGAAFGAGRARGCAEERSRRVGAGSRGRGWGEGSGAVLGGSGALSRVTRVWNVCRFRSCVTESPLPLCWTTAGMRCALSNLYPRYAPPCPPRRSGLPRAPDELPQQLCWGFGPHRSLCPFSPNRNTGWRWAYRPWSTSSASSRQTGKRGADNPALSAAESSTGFLLGTGKAGGAGV